MPERRHRKTLEWIFESDIKFPLRARREDPQEVTVLHDHDFCECIFVISGTGLHQSADHPPIELHRGDVLFIPIGSYHAYIRVDDLVVFNLLFYAPRLPSVLLELYSSPAYKQIFLKKFDPLDKEDCPMTHLPDDVLSELEMLLNYLESSSSHCSKMGIFVAILGRLCEEWHLSGEEKSPSLDVFKLTSFMQENFHKDLSMADLCRLAAMSGATLQRHFRAALGVPPMAYLRRLRLSHAAELLLNSELDLTEIAELSGYKQMPPFFRAFKKCYGTTPLEYRKKR